MRTCPADGVPLSAASDRDTLYLAVHTNAAVGPPRLLPRGRGHAAGYGGRPHWGKLHNRTAEDLETAYPRWQDFQAMRDRLDPDRIFTNPYLDRVLGS